MCFFQKITSPTTMIDGQIGSRQSPSLAEAMRQAPQLGHQIVYSPGNSTPNIYPMTSYSQDSRSYVHFSPPMSQQTLNESQPANIFNEIEKKICDDIDKVLKIHYKKVKNKLKKVKSRVKKTDQSIAKIQDLLDEVCDQIDNESDTNENEKESINKIITWRKKL